MSLEEHTAQDQTTQNASQSINNDKVHNLSSSDDYYFYSSVVQGKYDIVMSNELSQETISLQWVEDISCQIIPISNRHSSPIARCLSRTRHFYYHESLGFDCSGDLRLVLLMQNVFYPLFDNQSKVEQTLSTPTVGWIFVVLGKTKIALANDNKSPPAEIVLLCSLEQCLNKRLPLTLPGGWSSALLGSCNFSLNFSSK